MISLRTAPVALPDWVEAGRHRLRVVVEGKRARQALVVTAQPDPHSERGAKCWRTSLEVSPRSHHAVRVLDVEDLYRVERVGYLVRVTGSLALRVWPGVGDDHLGDYGVVGEPEPGTVFQMVYRDGSVGERWQFDEDGGTTCHEIEQPLATGSGVPLWVDDWASVNVTGTSGW